MDDLLAESIAIMNQNGAEKESARLGGVLVDLYLAKKLEAALARKLRIQILNLIFGKEGMIVEIPLLGEKINLDEIGMLSPDEFKERTKQFKRHCDLILVSKSDLPVQTSFLSTYGYSDGTEELNERLKDCESLLSKIWSLAYFKLDVVGPGHCGIVFDPKLKAAQLEPIADLVDAFIEMHDIRDLSKKGLLTHMRASGSVIF